MTYNIIGIFPTIDDAISAAKQLTNAGFIKQFPGFTKNSKFQPESLVEDHFIDQNEISVYTPNLNRAHKAKNILIKFGGELNKIKGLYYEKVQNTKPTNTSLILFKKRKQLKDYKIKLSQKPIDLLNNK
ncbi:hypothetical protein Q73A0000_06145 [Kaistella flava (ex Peng et al. 2021)]|uniref:Uncharacterized protein n=1 Tax=Kaistella flava (ex Peng et al. 2021) TaxID=2038776 RepID=A0A7M2Y7A4_9FLAO|nr:hypothetical protein [Kaistella flava (ex Peng et al. 2021)]QOW09970.1 hypothetical protein Q73A0000_06145 [Kaistella flava (ex Peng et al. 2021)]